MKRADEIHNNTDLARFYKDEIFSRMSQIRVLVDTFEERTDSSLWPYPTYGAILFSVK